MWTQWSFREHVRPVREKSSGMQLEDQCVGIAKCEFRKVKSIMRQQRYDLTGTLGCYIQNRLKRQKRGTEVKYGWKTQDQQKKPEDDFWRDGCLDSRSDCEFCEELGFIWQWCLLCDKSESDLSLCLLLPHLWGQSWSSKSTSAGTHFYIQDKKEQVIRYRAAAESVDGDDKHVISHFITSFH